MISRSDANQSEIVNLFRAAGATVDVMSNVGHGFPDIIVNYRGLFAIVEIKNGRHTLREKQKEWFANHEGLRFVARDSEDVEKILSRMAKIADAAETQKEGDDDHNC